MKVIVDTASTLVTAEAVRFALQGALADGQFVHQHLGRLQANSRTSSLGIIEAGRYLRELRVPPLTMQEEGLTKGTSCPSHCPMSGAS